MEIEGRTKGGVKGSVRLDDYGNVAITSGGALREAALGGRLFSVMNQAAVATTADDALTWTGLGIANPTGSGKKAIMHGFCFALTVVGSDEGALSLMVGTEEGFADNLTIVNSLPSGSASKMYADDGATIVDATLWQTFAMYGTGAITTWNMSGPNTWDLRGSYILEPGRAIMTSTTTALTTSPICGFMWEEVDA